MDIERVIGFILGILFFFGVGLLIFAAGFDQLFSFFHKIDKYRIKKFKWIKTKAKIVNIKKIPKMQARGSHGRMSYTVVYYDNNVRYKSHVLDPQIIIKGKYVYLYYKKNKPQIVRVVKRPTPRDIPIAIFFFAFALIEKIQT